MPAQPTFPFRLRFGQDDRSFLCSPQAMLAGAAVCGIDLREEEDFPPDQLALALLSELFDPIHDSRKNVKRLGCRVSPTPYDLRMVLTLCPMRYALGDLRLALFPSRLTPYDSRLPVYFLLSMIRLALNVVRSSVPKFSTRISGVTMSSCLRSPWRRRARADRSSSGFRHSQTTVHTSV